MVQKIKIGSRDQEHSSLKPTQAYSSGYPISKKKNHSFFIAQIKMMQKWSNTFLNIDKVHFFCCYI
jgi:hypothetical protein